MKAALLQLRNMCADWGGEPSDLMDEKKMVSKDFKFSRHIDDYPARLTPPSQTQLWLMRATTRALYDERSPYTKGSLMQVACVRSLASLRAPRACPQRLPAC